MLVNRVWYRVGSCLGQSPLDMCCLLESIHLNLISQSFAILRIPNNWPPCQASECWWSGVYCLSNWVQLACCFMATALVCLPFFSTVLIFLYAIHSAVFCIGLLPAYSADNCQTQRSLGRPLLSTPWSMLAWSSLSWLIGFWLPLFCLVTHLLYACFVVQALYHLSKLFTDFTVTGWGLHQS